MSFFCKACGRYRADGNEVCSDCKNTQMAKAIPLLHHFDKIRFDDVVLQSLDEILSEAQNSPPEGFADRSIPEARWTAIRDLIKSARAYNEARVLVLALLNERKR